MPLRKVHRPTLKHRPTLDEMLSWFLWHNTNILYPEKPDEFERWIKEWRKRKAVDWHRFLYDLYPSFREKYEEPTDSDQYMFCVDAEVRRIRANGSIEASNDSGNVSRVKRDKSRKRTKSTGAR